MKKLALILVLCLLLCGCGTKKQEGPDSPLKVNSGENTQTTMETGLPEALKEQPTESSVWKNYNEYTGKLGLILNEPVENPPRVTTRWMEGEQECAYIVPRFVGSYVNLYALEWSEDGSSYTIGEVAEYSTLVGDGCVIYTVLPRPEGMPQWYVEIVAPNGVGDGFVLEYDGKDGIAPVEFFDYRP